ncbi:hypothetical protein ABBQ32_000803 [Trebouxia sp. C0010 RCD-2024]
MIGFSSRFVTGPIWLLICVVAVARGTRLLGTRAATTSASSVVFGFCSSEQTVKERVSYVQSWWQAQHNGLLLVDHIPDGLPALPIGLQVQAADNKWKFVSSAERCAWSQVSDTHKAFPQADWYALGDDDTFFIPQALELALSKYDASKPWYIGAPSESGKQNYDLGIWLLSNGDQIGEFAFGGAGIIISQGLMQTLIPKFEECLHNHDGMIGGDQRIGACVKVLSPGIQLTHFMGMHQVDSFHHNFDFLALFEAHPVQPLISLHHLGDILPGFGNLFGLRPYAKRNPFGILQQSVCYSKDIGTFSIAAGLSVRWWDNDTDIKVGDLIDYASTGSLPPVTRSFPYAKSLNAAGNLRSSKISTWYAADDAFSSGVLKPASTFSKIQVEEAAGPGRWMAVKWDRLRCSHVSHNLADDSLSIVLGGPHLPSAA